MREGRSSKFKVSRNRGNRSGSNVQIQRCVIWKVSSPDEIWYDDKLKEKEHEENIDDNDDKQDVEPPSGLLQITNLWWV